MAKKRTLDQVNQEYSIFCGYLGENIHRTETLERQREDISKRLRELDHEATLIRQKQKPEPVETPETTETTEDQSA